MNLALRGIAGLVFGVMAFACGRGLTYRSDSTDSVPQKCITRRQTEVQGQGIGDWIQTPGMSQIPSVGNTVVVAVWAFGSGAISGSTASDNIGHSYTQAAEAMDGSSYVAIFFTTLTNPSAGLQVRVDFTPAGIVQSSNILASEFTEIAPVSPFDRFFSNSSPGPTTNAAAGPTPITTSQNELIFAAVTLSAVQTFITPSASSFPTAGYVPIFTDLGTFATGQAIYQVVSTIGSPDAAWNYSIPTGFASVIATFRAAY